MNDATFIQLLKLKCGDLLLNLLVPILNHILENPHLNEYLYSVLFWYTPRKYVEKDHVLEAYVRKPTPT